MCVFATLYTDYRDTYIDYKDTYIDYRDTYIDYKDTYIDYKDTYIDYKDTTLRRWLCMYVMCMYVKCVCILSWDGFGLLDRFNYRSLSQKSLFCRRDLKNRRYSAKQT